MTNTVKCQQCTQTLKKRFTRVSLNLLKTQRFHMQDCSVVVCDSCDHVYTHFNIVTRYEGVCELAHPILTYVIGTCELGGIQDDRRSTAAIAKLSSSYCAIAVVSCLAILAPRRVRLVA